MSGAAAIHMRAGDAVALCHAVYIPGNVSAELLSDEEVFRFRNVIQSTLLDT